jgi:hypothetical protein
MEEPVCEIEHIVANFVWDSMPGDVEEADSGAGFVDLACHFLTVGDR